jgi:hypothetical protein
MYPPMFSADIPWRGLTIITALLIAGQQRRVLGQHLANHPIIALGPHHMYSKADAARMCG